MTPVKIALAGAAMAVLLIMFATRPDYSAPPTEPVVNAIPTMTLVQTAFDHPSWEPDEATKTRALKRAYEIVGSMNDWGGIDMTLLANEPLPMPADPLPPPDRISQQLNMQVADSGAKNALDAIADMVDPAPAPKRDICKIHKMHKVTSEGGKSWRCRK